MVFMSTDDTIITNTLTDEQATKFTNVVRQTSQTAGHSPPPVADATFTGVVNWMAAAGSTPATPTSAPPLTPTSAAAYTGVCKCDQAKSSTICRQSSQGGYDMCSAFPDQTTCPATEGCMWESGGGTSLSVVKQTVAVNSASLTVASYVGNVKSSYECGWADTINPGFCTEGTPGSDVSYKSGVAVSSRATAGQRRTGHSTTTGHGTTTGTKIEFEMKADSTAVSKAALEGMLQQAGGANTAAALASSVANVVSAQAWNVSVPAATELAVSAPSVSTWTAGTEPAGIRVSAQILLSGPTMLQFTQEKRRFDSWLATEVGPVCGANASLNCGLAELQTQAHSRADGFQVQLNLDLPHFVKSKAALGALALNILIEETAALHGKLRSFWPQLQRASCAPEMSGKSQLRDFDESDVLFGKMCSHASGQQCCVVYHDRDMEMININGTNVPHINTNGTIPEMMRI